MATKSKKGTQASVEAGKKAWQTRLENGWKPKKKKAKVPSVKLVPIKLTRPRDTEEYVMYTDGPSKITYSAKYNTFRISPHNIILTSKKK